jgi:hypothetical protein
VGYGASSDFTLRRVHYLLPVDRDYHQCEGGVETEEKPGKENGTITHSAEWINSEMNYCKLDIALESVSDNN